MVNFDMNNILRKDPKFLISFMTIYGYNKIG